MGSLVKRVARLEGLAPAADPLSELIRKVWAAKLTIPEMNRRRRAAEDRARREAEEAKDDEA